MKLKELKQRSAGELSKLLSEARSKLRQERFGSTGTKVKNVKVRMNTKKEIARILTLLREQKNHG